MPTIALKIIYDAIKMAVEECGSESELARRCNLEPKVINRYMNNKVKRITEEKWLKLEPHVKRFLPANLDCECIGFAVKREPQPQILSSKMISRVMLDVFDQLDSDAQHEIIKQAEQYLTKQQIDRNETLMQEEDEKLVGFGITCRYNTEYRFTTQGLCWLYNGIEYNKKHGELLTVALLKKLLQSEPPVSHRRKLCIRALAVEVDRDEIYYQYAFYLNGTPPKLYTAGFDKTYRLTDHFEFYPTLKAPFGVDDESYVEVFFTSEEIAELKAGKTLKI